MDCLWRLCTCSLTHLFWFLFSLQKAAIYWAPVARTVNYLWMRVMCLCICLVYIWVHVCVFICIFDRVVFSGTMQCPAPSARPVRTTMTSVLTLCFRPPAWITRRLTIGLFVGQSPVLLPSISPEADSHEFSTIGFTSWQITNILMFFFLQWLNSNPQQLLMSRGIQLLLLKQSNHPIISLYSITVSSD